jgi:hypothetical protein
VPAAIYFHGKAWTQKSGDMDLGQLKAWKNSIQNPEINWQGLETRSEVSSLADDLDSLSPV